MLLLVRFQDPFLLQFLGLSLGLFPGLSLRPSLDLYQHLYRVPFLRLFLLLCPVQYQLQSRPLIHHHCHLLQNHQHHPSLAQP